MPPEWTQHGEWVPLVQVPRPGRMLVALWVGWGQDSWVQGRGQAQQVGWVRSQESPQLGRGAQILTGVQDAKGALTPTVIQASRRGVWGLHS